MEALAKQLQELRAKVAALSTAARIGIFGGIAALVIAIVVASMAGGDASFQYAFTNLTSEDAGEMTAQLKAAGVPHRLEAGGSALAVPADQVYDARLLLAAAGLPRGGGVGFEIFDKGDLGISEFTQKVNLRRATEGELSRTIGRLAAIRSARVHITLPEKGLYRDEDRKAAAAVVVSLQPGRTLAEREVQGIRHLVASAVPGLDPESVTIVDGRGGVLASQTSAHAKAASEQGELERGLEGRVIELLEKAVGPGAVVAKVTAAMDTSEVESTADAYDPEAAAVRSERKTTEQVGPGAGGPNGVAGAAANQPMNATATGGGGLGQGASSREDEVKNYEISKTITRTVTRGPRLRRLSVAVLVDGKDGAPRAAAELARLGELAKGAVGFDATRGDKFEITSVPFAVDNNADNKSQPVAFWAKPAVKYGAIGAAALLLLLIIGGVVLLRGRKRAAVVAKDVALLQPGSKVADIEAILSAGATAALQAPEGAAPGPGAQPAIEAVDPNLAVRDKARRIASEDPERAALLLKAWIQSDLERKELVGA